GNRQAWQGQTPGQARTRRAAIQEARHRQGRFSEPRGIQKTGRDSSQGERNCHGQAQEWPPSQSEKGDEGKWLLSTLRAGLLSVSPIAVDRSGELYASLSQDRFQVGGRYGPRINAKVFASLQ